MPLEKLVRLGFVLAIAGMLLAALAPLDSTSRTLGGALLLSGWALAGYSLHRYGRAG